MHARAVVLGIAVWAVMSAGVGARAQPVETPVPVAPDAFSGRTAVPLARGDGSVALLSESRFGLGHDLQIGTHLIGLVAPHVSVLARIAHGRRWHLAVRGCVAYPYPFLALVTGRGALALLPVDRDPAQALLFDLGARASLELGRGQWVTFEAAVAAAARFGEQDTTLLDFPFLYPRLAALEGRPTVRLAATAEGRIHGGFRWVLALEYSLLTVVERGFALEQRAGLAWFARRRIGLQLGGRGSFARYEIGTRFHVTPYADLEVRF